jgi:hypothetical protein
MRRPPNAGKTVQRTPDGRHVIINGRKWRATNPDLPEDERKRLVTELMAARRDVGRALKAGDKTAETAARARVHAAKVGLGERGPKWWEQQAAGHAFAPEPGTTP